MKYSSYCWLFTPNSVLPTLARMSDLPPEALRSHYNGRHYVIREVPVRRFTITNSPNSRPGARKLSPRAGKQRRYLSGEFAKYYDNSSHKSAKTLAHRAARRKARLYFTAADPDGEYNANFNPGLTAWDF